MWALLSRRFWMWLVLAVAAPALSWVLGKAGDRIEAKNGPTTSSRLLRQGRRWLGRRSKGPMADRSR